VSEDGLIFDIDTFAVHDGPGIRMAVYLKGCQLACKWCHSPESLRPAPELIFMRDRCALCGGCAAVCPREAHRVNGRERSIDRDRCLACGLCVEHCARGALRIKGCRISADAIVLRAARMKPFFDHSSGGITLTGGEVTVQPRFAEEILDGCRSLGIATAIETNGACDWPVLEPLLARSDLVLYDLKLIDEEEHIRWVGSSNRQVLDNAARLAGHDVQVRVPLVPGVTDTQANLQGVFEFMCSVGLCSVGLLPFNPFTSAKYEWLGLECEVQGEPQSSEHLDRLVALARSSGLHAAIV